MTMPTTIPRYRHLTDPLTIVEAVHYSGARGQPHAIYRWLGAATICRLGVTYTSPTDGGTEITRFRLCAEEETPVPVGSWVVRKEDGHVEVMPHATFCLEFSASPVM